MLHQTLIPSLPSSASSSSPFFPHANAAATTTTTPPAPAPRSSSTTCLRGSAMPSYANHHSLPPLDGRMDTMKSCGFPPEETAEEAAAASLVERDGFSVEDLLDLEEFGEPDKDDDEHEEAPPPAVTAAAEELEKVNKSLEDSQPMSMVEYELPPPPPEMVDLPAHDVAEELEWVSRIMDDSELPPPPQPLAMAAKASHAAAAKRPPLAYNHHHRPTYAGAYRPLPPAPGPLRATPTVCALSTEAMVPVKARRSKRARSSAWSLSGAPLFSDSTSSSTTTTSSSSSSSAASFSPFFLMDSHTPPFGSADFEGGYNHHFLSPPLQKKSKHGKGGGKNGGKPKKRGRKPKLAPHAAASAAASQQAAAQGDRRCSHCGVQKTPQWRAGPEGAKTLCNACGVRYKSGRLLPEYRPACSPTFVSSIHSNSHRKVLEMRRKKEAGLIATAAPPVASF